MLVTNKPSAPTFLSTLLYRVVTGHPKSEKATHEPCPYYGRGPLPVYLQHAHCYLLERTRSESNQTLAGSCPCLKQCRLAAGNL